MPGAIPAPVKGTALHWTGQPALVGDVELSAGQGLYPRTDESGNKLLLDGQTAGPAQSASFALQTPAVGVIGKMTNPGRDGTCVITVVDVNQATAPTGTTADDHLTVRVSGQSGGSADLPIRTAFQSLDYQSPSTAAGAAGFTTDAVVAAQQANWSARGVASGFTTAADTEVLGAQMRCKVYASDNPYMDAAGRQESAGVLKRFELLDKNMRRIVAVDSRAGFSDLDTLSFLFPVKLTLTAGEFYYAALSLPEARQSLVTDLTHGLYVDPRRVPGLSPCGASSFAGGTTPGNGGSLGWRQVLMGSWYAPGTSWADLAIVDAAGARLPDPVTGLRTEYSRVLTDSSERLVYAGTGDGFSPPAAVKLLGSATGFTVSGPITVEVVNAGVGPTTPGAALNIRLSAQGG